MVGDVAFAIKLWIKDNERFVSPVSGSSIVIVHVVSLFFIAVLL